MKKLNLLNGSFFLGKEIDELVLDVVQKRLINAAIASFAVTLPATAIFLPNQPDGNKLLQLLAGSIGGFASAIVAKSREDIENRYEAYLQLNRETQKLETKNRFIKQQFTLDVTKDVSIAEFLKINGIHPQAMAEYIQRNNLPIGLIADILQQATPASEPQSANNNNFAERAIAKPNSEILDLHINKTASALIKAMASKYPDYVRIDNKWIDDLIESSSAMPMSKRANHHFMIVAETQAGKSTLAGVIANGIASRSQSPAVIAVHDAKKKPGKKDITRWLCDFTYKVDGYENTENWIELMETLASEQLDLVSESGGSCEGVRELILLQDEHNTVYGKGKGYGKYIDSDCAVAAQAQWLFITTNLAGAKGHGIFMGQSPLSGDTGFSLPAMNNTCFIAMGETSSYILDAKNRSNYVRNISEEYLTVLQQTCELFQKEGLRYCLVRPTRGNPFVAIIPEFNVEAIVQKLRSEQSQQPQQPQQSQQPQEPEQPQEPQQPQPPASNIEEIYTKIKKWMDTCFEKYGRYPNSEHIRKAWEEETGVTLNDAALEYLISKLIDK
jgi:hypothetical protein